jgi:hypothetical protein
LRGAHLRNDLPANAGLEELLNREKIGPRWSLCHLISSARKLSGFTRPSKANEEALELAVEKVTAAAHELLDSLVTTAPPRDREIEAAKARARAAERFPSAASAGD